MRNFTDEDRQKALETRRNNKQMKTTEQMQIVKPVITSAEVERKRSELEALRLDVEIDRLRKPDTSIDYYAQMLQLQKEHNNQLLQMQRENFDVQLQLEKMKLGQGEADEFSSTLETLTPFFPMIAEGIKSRSQIQQQQQKDVKIPSAAVEQKEKEMIPNADELEKYKEKIRKGEITKEQAWQDFQEQVPPIVVKQMGYAGFEAEFEKVKAGLK